MATDLTTMKARIARELGNRTDLTTEIGEAISDAITIYQNDRFYFNESRAITFSTVASQEFYTSADNANIPNLLAIDYVMKQVGSNQVTGLTWIDPDTAEDLSNNGTITGEPYNYSYYNQQIRLQPVPLTVITIRIAGHIKLAAPATDVETTNAWLTEAEWLIRSRAKYQLAKHKTLNAAMAAAMSPLDPEGESYLAYCALKGRTNRQVGSGIIAASSAIG